MTEKVYYSVIDSPIIPQGSKADFVFSQGFYFVDLPCGAPLIYQNTGRQMQLSPKQVENNSAWVTANKWEHMQKGYCECSRPSKCMGTCLECGKLYEGYVEKKRVGTNCTDPVERVSMKTRSTGDIGEQKRQESMAKRFYFVPKKGEKYFYYNVHSREIYSFTWVGDVVDVALWNIGNIHRTKAEAEAWGRDYAPYFTMPSSSD